MLPLTRAAWRKLMFTIADYRLERACQRRDKAAIRRARARERLMGLSFKPREATRHNL